MATEWSATEPPSVLAGLTEPSPELFRSLATEIDEKRKTLLQIIEVLGPNLTNADLTIRQNALGLIVGIVENVKRDTFSEQEVSSLCDFLCSRLLDHQQLLPQTLRGLNLLVKMENFRDDPQQIIDNLAENVHVPSLPRLDRLNVYALFEALVDRFPTELEKMGSNLLMRYITCMDGEHEPRNLLIVFRTFFKIVRKFDVGSLAETAFDVVACYFPIDFNPTAQEDIQENLKDGLTTGLRRCLTASPKFAKYCLPLILEKLMSDSNDAKVESLNSLVALCEEGLPVKPDVVEQLPSVWMQLRREILAPPTDSVEDAAAKALTSVTVLLSRGSQDGEEGVNSFVTKVLSETEQFFRKPELQLQHPAGKILQAVALGSVEACGRIADTTLPLTVRLLMEHLRSDDRIALLNVMALILKAMGQVSTGSHMDENERISIAVFYQSLIGQSPQSMINCMAINSLALMLRIRLPQPFIHHDRVEQICETLMNGVMDYENSGVVDEVTNFFKVAGEVEDEAYIFGKLLPRLFEYIKNREVLPLPVRLLDLATALLRTPRPKRSSDFIDTLIERVRFNDEKGPFVPSMKMYLDIIATYVEGVGGPGEALSLHQQVLFPTLKSAIHAATSEDTSGFQDISILLSLSRIYRSIVSHMDKETYGNLIKTLDTMYLRGDTSYRHEIGRGDNLGDKLLPSAFKPLEKPYVTTHTRCISILTSIVCSSPKDFTLVYGQWLKRVLSQLMETCCFCADEQSSVFAAQCIGGLVNRMEDEKVVKECLGDLLDSADLAKARSQERRYTRVIIWITKGLVLRSQPDASIRQLTEMIFTRLKNHKSGAEAADGLRVILEDSPFVLTPQMNAVISPLYRQKFFLQTLPLLLASFDQNNETDKSWIQRNHLVALSHLLRCVPQSVTKAFMPKVVPLLLHSLSGDNADLLLSTLTSFEELLLESECGASTTLGTVTIPPLIERLLDLSATSTNMEVRVAAVRTLGFVGTQCPTPALVPYKVKVLKTLLKVLDDKKRRVREAAVDARGLWCLLSSSTGNGA